MGWGLEIPMYLSRVTLEDARDKLEEATTYEQDLRSQLLMLVSATPSYSPELTHAESMMDLQRHTSELLDELREASRTVDMLSSHFSDPTETTAC